MTKTTTETKQIIVGTAGHIDHGKTALVKALTGIDADTLAEEKRRGITIELGFVFMETPGFDKQIVFIDVPGHEKLIKTMVAGASNIDAALLVIAADDGISAQTVEHFDILQLLGIGAGVIALTKVDLVSEERIREVTEQVRSFVTGTFLCEAPILPVSSATGSGVEGIRSALVAIGQNVKERQDSGIFRMPIDRVFTMRGFGVVIAGTLLSGQVSVGDRIEIFPDEILAKVRGIQIHNQSSQESFIGRRTALNLQDVKKDQLRRGQCAGAPGSLTPTARLDARVHLLKSTGKELKNRSRLRIHIGTDEVICRLVLLDRETLLPGQTCLAQFVLESPTVALTKDRFIIRTFSPLRTIGGGEIIDAAPRRHSRFDDQTLDGLKKLEGALTDLVEQMYLKASFVPQSMEDVALRTGEKEEDVRRVVDDLSAAGKLVKIGKGDSERHLHAMSYDDLTSRLIAFMKGYFSRNPYRLLMPLGDLQSQFLRLGDRQTLDTIIDDLCGKQRVYKKGSRIGLVGYEIGLKPGERELADRIEAIFREAQFAPPLEADVRSEVGASPETFGNLVRALIEQELLVRLSDKVTYHREHLQAVKEIVAEHAKKQGGMTVAELRDNLNISRKYALALLEYFDSMGFTKREGDKHVLR